VKKKAPITGTGVLAAALLCMAAACGGGVSGSTTTSSTVPSSSTPTSSGPTTTTPSGPTPGVTAKTITVGNVSTTGGLVPGLFLGAQVGVQAYFDYVNSTGGVDGRTLVVDDRDDQLFCTNNKTETEDLIPSVLAFVGSFSIYDSCGGAIIPSTIANISNSLDPAVTKLPNTFSPQPIQNGWGTGPLLWLKQHYPGAVGHVGALVGDVTTVENSWAGEEYALKQEGFHISVVETYTPGQTQFAADVIKMQQEGVQLVLLDQADVGAIAAFVDAMQLQGFHPEVISNSGSAYDGSFITKAGAAAAGTVIVNLHEALYLGQDANSVPEVKLFDHWINVAHAGYTPDIYSVFGWASAMLLVQALQKAGPNPDHASLLAALGTIHTFDAGGLLAPDDPASKTPADCFLVARVVNGSWQRVTPSSGFTCSGTYIYDPKIP
jgi:ABC-type branched-subunit amino acid transport system substrate-binding protein